MQVNDFLVIVGNYLQEDFVNSPVWTKVELLGYTKQIYRIFCQLTGLIDKTEIRLINATTGEADVPKDFEHLWFAQFEQRNLDITELDELDFVFSTWASGAPGTPDAVTVIGSGDNAVARYVPRPSSVWDGGSSHTLVTPDLFMTGGGNQYLVYTFVGVLVSTLATGADFYPVLVSPGGNKYRLAITIDGCVGTVAVASGTPSMYLGLPDAYSPSSYWEVTVSDEGVLTTTPQYLDYGIELAALVDNSMYQDFNSEYGVIVDMYADESITSPAYTGRVNTSRGISLYAHTSDESGMIWYRGSLPELGSQYSELLLSDAFIPVILHGVLSLAYSHNSDGRDVQKSKLLNQVFRAECEAIRRSFQYRWA